MANHKSSAAQAIKDMLELGIDVTSQSFWDSILAFFDKLIDAIASIFG